MSGRESAAPDRRPALGLRQNWRQFWLLVIVNAFVGGMVGLERAILPLMAEREFGLASKRAILAFILSFGLVKAFTNLGAGGWADLIGRKRLLVAGWVAGLPVPFLLLWAPTWNWVIAANLLLGINQGLCWSMTVIMKIDLVGPQRRGFAMGLNESAGYGAVAIAALASAYLAGSYGLRGALFVLGVLFAGSGLLLSLLLVRDTAPHARAEAFARGGKSTGGLRFGKAFTRTSFSDPTLAACSQAGLVNNLNDGVAWGLFPIFFAAGGLNVRQIGILAATYPAVWGVLQIASGALSDRWGRKWMIASGMWIQAAGFWLMVAAPASVPRFGAWLAASVLLGLGTALVYPTLLAAIGDVAHPDWRASAVGVYRLWRDLGYAIGALACGALADLVGLSWTIAGVGALTFASGLGVALQMRARDSGLGGRDSVPRPESLASPSVPGWSQRGGSGR